MTPSFSRAWIPICDDNSYFLADNNNNDNDNADVFVVVVIVVVVGFFLTRWNFLGVLANVFLMSTIL